MLPADLDGSTAPPAGAPNSCSNFGTNSAAPLEVPRRLGDARELDADRPDEVPVAAFSPACSGGGTCIPQPGTTQKLDSLADRLMYRLAYRNFGDHESLVVNHSVTAGSSVGRALVRDPQPDGTPTVFQQGTYAPDAHYRWMGSVAMDKQRQHRRSATASRSSTVRPGIRYTAHARRRPARRRWARARA